jgi:hypothetical protein
MRIFYILLSTILLINTQARSQVRPLTPDPEHKLIKFYPNPAISFITFEIDKESTKTYSLQIFSFLGKKVKDVPDLSNKTLINISDLIRGIYTFQLKDETGRVTDTGLFQVNK